MFAFCSQIASGRILPPAAGLLLLASAAAGCGDDASGQADTGTGGPSDSATDPGATGSTNTGPGDGAAPAIRPGAGIGPVELGMRYAEVERALGSPQTSFPANRVIVSAYDTPGLEVVFASPSDELADDAFVLAVGAKSSGRFSGPVVPGMTRAEVEAAMGVPPDAIDDGAYVYYPAGVTVRYTGDTAIIVGVVSSYEPAPEPPPMQPAKGAGS